VTKLILIADDDENDALAIQETLVKAGVKNLTTTVSDGTGVIAYFRGQGQYWDREKFPIPSVLMLDLKMPTFGGFAVMEWLNYQYESVRSNILIVVLTGHGELENVRRAYPLGARSFLTKPCVLEDVRNLVMGYPEYWTTEMAPEAPTMPSSGELRGSSVAGAAT